MRSYTYKYGALYVPDPNGATHPLEGIRKSVVVTPGVYFGQDITDIYNDGQIWGGPILCKCLYSGLGGDVTVIQLDETVVTYKALPEGVFALIRCIQVVSTTIASSSLLWCI